MKRFFIVIMALVMAFSISGCANASLDTDEKIVSPVNNSIPIQGKWELCMYPSSDDSQNKQINDELIGKYVQFSKDVVAIGDHLWKNTGYKMKKVKTDEYLVSRYELSKKNIEIDEKESYVITITSGDAFICEFLKINNNEMIGFIQNNVYDMKKISDNLDESFMKASEGDTKLVSDSSQNGNNEQYKTGLMLGLRYPKNSGKKSTEYEYRTLWISIDSGKLNPILETKNIFFPRKSGFWKLESARINENGIIEDALVAYRVPKINSNESINIKITSSRWKNRKGSIYRKIYYVGNDYISFETNGSGTYEDSSKKWTINRLQLQPVDNIYTMRGVKISDFFGENGLSAMESAKDELIEGLNGKQIREVNISDNSENFGLVRKTGHWYFKGRFDYLYGGTLSYMDYYINLIPPDKLVFYDSLYVSWRDVKDKVPEAIDAFTSPNRDIALIVTKNKINIYTVNDGKLGEKPLETISLKDGETVIMSEWANNSYVESWENSFISNIEK